MDAASRPQELTTPAGKRAKVPARRSRSIDVRLARRLLMALGNAPLEFVLGWTGSASSARGAPVAQIRICRPRHALERGRRSARELRRCLQRGPRPDRRRSAATCWKSSTAVPRPAAPAAPSRACCRAALPPRAAIRCPVRATTSTSHYDIGNEFYSLWLGETMAYTCAYYPTAEASLDEAQVAKMDHVCRKLRLRPGDTRGRGRLRLGQPGAAHGQPLRRARCAPSTSPRSRSPSRASAPSEQGLRGGSSSSRTITATSPGRYDVFVSVGMLEHVGTRELSANSAAWRARVAGAPTDAA